VPWLLLSLHAGALADRFERARVMAVATISRALILCAMAALLVLHRVDLALLLVFVLANASGRAIYYAASQAAVPELVDATELNRANGLLYGTEAATENLAGPIIGTIAFVAARALPFLCDALAMAASGLSLLGLHTKRPEQGRERPKLLEGMSYLFKDRGLRLLVSLIACLAGLQGLVTGVLVLVATRNWGVHPAGYGAFLATSAVGNILGGIGADGVASKIGTARTLIGAALVSGVGYLVMAFSDNWALAGIAFAGVGFAVGCGGVVAISLRQKLTPDELMGRVGSAWRGIVWGAAPTGALIAGVLATAGGLRLPLYVAGGAQCVVAVLLTRPLLRTIGATEVLRSGSEVGGVDGIGTPSGTSLDGPAPA
jgi:MFS family permease